MAANPTVHDMRLLAAGIATLLVVCARDLPAQTLDDLTAGVRIRAYGFEATPQGNRKYETTGQVAGRDSIRLVIVRDAATKFDTLPFFAMTTLQMNQGKTSRAKLMATGTTIGAAGGAALYIIARALPLDTPDPSQPANGDMKSLAKRSIPLLAALGLAIGSFADTDIWVTVRIPASVYGK
jgi:hypothetical protein